MKRWFLIGFVCFLFLLGNTKVTRALFIVNPGDVGSNIDSTRITFATSVDTTTAFQDIVTFEDEKYLELSSRYSFRIGFLGDGIGPATDHSSNEILYLLDENSATIAQGNNNSTGMGPDARSYSWDEAHLIPSANIYGFRWDITPDIIGTLPSTVDIYFTVYDYSWPDEEIMVGGPAPVPEPATMLLLGSGLVGLAVFRRKKRN